MYNSIGLGVETRGNSRNRTAYETEGTVLYKTSKLQLAGALALPATFANLH